MPSAPLRILVIDDDPDLKAGIHGALSAEGHVVDTAADGAEGLERWKAHPHDLVISDVIMPGKEGMEVLFEILDTRPEQPVIVMSGGGMIAASDYLDDARTAGAREVLQKPFSIQALLAAVERALTGSPGNP